MFCSFVELKNNSQNIKNIILVFILRLIHKLNVINSKPSETPNFEHNHYEKSIL